MAVLLLFVIGGVCLPVAAFALSLYYVYRYGVDLPIVDHWYFIYVLRNWHERNIEKLIQNILSQYTQYRPIVPRIILLALAQITGWDTRTEMWTSVGISVGIFGLALMIAKRANVHMWWLVALIAALSFSLGQAENLLWGWQIAVYLQVLFMLGALYALSHESKLGVSVAVLCAAGATFSYQTGIVLWLVGLLYLVARRLTLGYLVGWVVASVAFIALYYSNYIITPNTRALLSGPFDPIQFALFLVANIGAPLGVGNLALSIPMGAGIVAILLVCLLALRGQGSANTSDLTRGLLSRETAILVALVLTSLLSSGLIAFGRYRLGLEWAVLSRYTTVTSLGILGVLLLCLHVARMNPGLMGERLKAALVSLIIVGLAFSNIQGWLIGRQTWVDRMRLRYAAQVMDFEHTDLRPVFHTIPELRRMLAFLKERQLGIFREPPLIHIPRELEAKPASVIVPQKSLLQTFVCPVKSLYDFKLPFATFGRENTATLQVTLRDGGLTLYRQVISMRSIQANQWLAFELSNPLHNCAGKELTLELSSEDASAENTVTVWTFPATYDVVRSRTSPGIQEGYAVGLKLNYIHYRLPF